MKKRLGTPGERRPSRQENGKNGKEIKDYDALMVEIRKEFKQNEQYIEKKLLEVQDTLDKKLEGVVGELTGKVKDLTVRSKVLEESMKRAQKDLKESKKETDRIRGEIKDISKTQEELLDNMSMLEMRQKQLNLKFRGIPEGINENIRAKLIKELANWLDMRKEEIGYTIANAFRIKVKSARARGKKLLGDVPVMFNLMDMRNEILRLNYNKNVCIDGKAIIVFKEVPARFLFLFFFF
ncbi:Hypothetical predicted protein [Podarcis lilfordi]|uniref:L1 transposable element RRM domain-containing protein n=1 Tax=Podarcis lilfordi TaxID=74358 RepID=A0AA35QRB9_9SAUR|nr:Hypothetical predicted protein [Podarcis lilfordi]